MQLAIAMPTIDARLVPLALMENLDKRVSQVKLARQAFQVFLEITHLGH